MYQTIFRCKSTITAIPFQPLKLEMMILIILDNKVIIMVTMGCPFTIGEFGAAMKVLDATLDLIISEIRISLPKSSPPCSLHVVAN